jgi:cyclase
LVKTRRFRESKYVGDPINAVKIFNDKEVDEIAVLDISATRNGREPSFEHVAEIAGEAFMPLAYGGGVRTVGHIERVFEAGAEKVVLNTAAFENPELVTQAAGRYGSQSVVVSLDVKRDWLRRLRVYSRCGGRSTGLDPVTAARRMEEAGAGELLLHNIDREGMYSGYDVELIRSVAEAVGVPVVAVGGARNVDDLAAAVHEGHASAVMAGSMFVFHGPHRAVLINFPEQTILEQKVFPAAGS